MGYPHMSGIIMRRLIALSIALLAFDASAVLYFCEGPNGRIMRSEPCDKGEVLDYAKETRDVRYRKDPRAYAPAPSGSTSQPKAATIYRNPFAGAGGSTLMGSIFGAQVDLAGMKAEAANARIRSGSAYSGSEVGNSQGQMFSASPPPTINTFADQSRYRGYSGTQYKYDLSKPVDRIMYSVDPNAQIMDSILKPTQPGVALDASMGQRGGGVKY
ncbi:MAG: hypothetical protein KIT68_11130 [Phycisphaeraceae bacterium]|nr:hypothetical protein [Phycisphaeraceae bacterium]